MLECLARGRAHWLWISMVEEYSASSMKLTFSDSVISSCRLTPWPFIYYVSKACTNCSLNKE